MTSNEKKFELQSCGSHRKLQVSYNIYLHPSLYEKSYDFFAPTALGYVSSRLVLLNFEMIVYFSKIKK
jgi:hypothetical protein